MYGIELAVQIENLMPALGLGFLLGICYDFVRLLRLIFSRGKIFLFVTDTLFTVFCTAVSFLLFLGVNDGVIRLYLVLAEIIGATLYFFTAGKIVYRLFRRFSDMLRSAVHLIFAPFRFLKRKMNKPIEKIKENSAFYLKKIQNKFKKPLQEEEDLLYNNND